MGQLHAARLQRLPNVAVKLVADADPVAAADVARALKAEPVSLDAAVADDSVRAVIISSPTPTHAELSIRALEAGKAVFVEKPLAHDLEAADRTVAAVRATGGQLQVGFQRRYDPAYQEARRQIDTGQLGRIEGFRGVGRDTRAPPVSFLATSGGIFLDMGIHDLDAARFLVGEVEEVYATGGAISDPALAEHGLYDTAVATLKFASGAIGTLEVALNSVWGYDIRTEVVGSQGRVSIDMESRWHLKRYGPYGSVQERPPDFESRFSDACLHELEAFAHNVLAGRPVAPDAEDGRESLRLAMAAQQSLETGKVVRSSEVG